MWRESTPVSSAFRSAISNTLADGALSPLVDDDAGAAV